MMLNNRGLNIEPWGTILEFDVFAGNNSATLCELVCGIVIFIPAPSGENISPPAQPWWAHPLVQKKVLLTIQHKRHRIQVHTIHLGSLLKD